MATRTADAHTHAHRERIQRLFRGASAKNFAEHGPFRNSSAKIFAQHGASSGSSAKKLAQRA